MTEDASRLGQIGRWISIHRDDGVAAAFGRLLAAANHGGILQKNTLEWVLIAHQAGEAGATSESIGTGKTKRKMLTMTDGFGEIIDRLAEHYETNGSEAIRRACREMELRMNRRSA